MYLRFGQRITCLVILNLFMGAASLHADTLTSTQAGSWHTAATWGGSGVPDDGDDKATINHAVTITSSGLTSGTMINALTIGGSGTLRATDGLFIGADSITNNGSLSLSGTIAGGNSLTGTGSVTLTNGAGLIDTSGTFSSAFTMDSLSNDSSYVIADIETKTLALRGYAFHLGSVKADTIEVYRKAITGGYAANALIGLDETALTFEGNGVIQGKTLTRTDNTLAVINVDALTYGQNYAQAGINTTNTNSIVAKGELSISNVVLYSMDIDMQGGDNTLTVDNSTIYSINHANSGVYVDYLTVSDLQATTGAKTVVTNPYSDSGEQIKFDVATWTTAYNTDPGLYELEPVVTDTNDKALFSTITGAENLVLRNAHIQANVSDVKTVTLNGVVNAIDGVLAFDTSYNSFSFSGNASNTTNTELHLGGIKFTEPNSTLTLSNKLTTFIDDLSNTNIDTITVNSGAILGAGDGYQGNIVFNNGSGHYVNYSTFEANNITYDNGAKIYVGFDKSGDVNQVVTFGTIALGNNTEIRIVNTDGTAGAVSLDDIFSATGGITLGGTTLSDNTYEAKSGTVSITNGGSNLTITTNKLTSGTVTGAEVSGSGKTLSVNYTGTSVADTLFDTQDPDNPTPNPGPNPIPSGLSKNQGSLYGALSPALQLVVDDLNTLGEKAALLNEFSPIIHTATPQILQRPVTRVLRTHYDRHRTLFDFHSVNGLDFNAYPNPDMVFLGQSRSMPCRQYWFSNYGDWSCEKGSYGDGNNGYYSNMYGLNAGYDKYIGDNWVTGVSVGGAWNSFHARRDEDRGKGDTSTFLLSGYASWTDYCWYFGSAVGYSYSSIRLERDMPSIFERAHSTHSGNQVFASFELARKIEFGYFFVSPYFGLDIVYLGEGGYTEKGAEYGGQTIKRRSTMSYLQNFGARLGTEFMIFDHWMIEPYFYGGWVHDYGGSQIRSVGSFTNGGTAQFDIGGSKMHKNRGVLGLNFDVTFTECFSGNIGWDFEFNPDYNASNFRIGIQRTW